jgi:hypothetical protein
MFHFFSGERAGHPTSISFCLQVLEHDVAFNVGHPVIWQNYHVGEYQHAPDQESFTEVQDEVRVRQREIILLKK